MDRLGIEMLCVFGMPPIDYVQLVADLGCRYITTGLDGFVLKQLGYHPFSLRDDPGLRRELLAAMDDRGISISLGEGLLIAPGSYDRLLPCVESARALLAQAHETP